MLAKIMNFVKGFREKSEPDIVIDREILDNMLKYIHKLDEIKDHHYSYSFKTNKSQVHIYTSWDQIFKRVRKPARIEYVMFYTLFGNNGVKVVMDGGYIFSGPLEKELYAALKEAVNQKLDKQEASVYSTMRERLSK